MTNKPLRSIAAREAAERVLIRVVHHYGERPEFVVLGGLIPDLLCTRSDFRHLGTTDVDVQVNLEIECHMANAVRLEQALKNAGLFPSKDKLWRWTTDATTAGAVVQFELLADLLDQPTGRQIKFSQCDSLGAMNLRGTGFASRNVEVRRLKAQFDEDICEVEVNISGLAGFLLAKLVAAHSRHYPKDWYDIIFVLLHNDVGGPTNAAELILDQFADDDIIVIRSALDDLQYNFEGLRAPGPRIYAQQMQLNHPGLDPEALATNAIIAVQEFCQKLLHVN